MATMTRPVASRNWLLKVAPMFFSDMVTPLRSTLVLSHSRQVTPFSPRRARVPRSVTSPSTGVKSILKSPEWTIRPPGQEMARAQEPLIEWLTWMNSTVNAPSFTTSRGFTVFRTMPFTRCSRSLMSIRASVSLVPYTGAGAWGST